MGNIASSLDDKAKMDSGLSRCMFSADQQRYILTFLLFNHKDVYDKLKADGPRNQAQWCYLSNNKMFRDLFIYAR